MAEKPRDSEERTAVFAESVRAFVRKLPRTISNIEDVEPPVRALGSAAADCIEANESLGDKDRVMKFRTSRKVAKECELRTRLFYVGDVEVASATRNTLRKEAHELKLIFPAIVKKLERVFKPVCHSALSEESSRSIAIGAFVSMDSSLRSE